MTTIVAISDTHTLHRQLIIPKADILIHCGDITAKGEEETLVDFIYWLTELKQVTHKIFIAGNHDFCLQKNSNNQSVVAQVYSDAHKYNVRYLKDQELYIDGLCIYGTPWTPFFYDWAFNGLEERPNEGYGYPGGPGLDAQPDKDHPLLSNIYSAIPADTNILVAHTPPRLDGLDLSSRYVKCGSYELMNRINQLKNLKLGLYGHIHESFGSTMKDGVLHANVCSLHRDYATIRQPVPFEI